MPADFGISASPFLTVSVGEPFEGFCYKLVCGVVNPDLL